MDYAKYRNLSAGELKDLHARALAGDSDATFAVVCFAIWKTILADHSIATTDKSLTHENLMKKIRITVES